ncbi:MAG TPA: hypothetical protein VHE33_13195 [Acidobacteriaceae bacterium]|nr:hypothetical protein [Acidobacteriaceae bacterium]
MAGVPDGVNAGRIGRPARQSPARKYNGRNEPGVDPTNELGQTPSEIVGGFSQNYSTGAPGTRGGSAPANLPTIQAGQLDPGLAGVTGSQLTNTGMPGSDGARNGVRGETVTYTDPFGFLGGVNRSVSVQGQVDGEGDWTQANDAGYSGGPQLPILQNNRPTSTGMGQGRVRTHHRD